MPTWRIHKLLDKWVLGEEHPDVHAFLDVPGTLINGSVFGHRKVWGHNLDYAFLVYILTKDENKFLSAVLHQLADKTISYKGSKKIELLLDLLK